MYFDVVISVPYSSLFFRFSKTSFFGKSLLKKTVDDMKKNMPFERLFNTFQMTYCSINFGS